MNTRAFLKLSNRTLITSIVHTIRSKSINCHLIKIKGHSGLEGNKRADHLAKLGSYSNLTLNVDNQDLCSKLHISPTWNSLPIEQNIRAFVKNIHKKHH